MKTKIIFFLATLLGFIGILFFLQGYDHSFYYGIGGMGMLLCISLYFIIVHKMQHSNPPHTTTNMQQMNYEEMIATYGQPTEKILANYTLPENMDNGIYFYDERQMMMINGINLNYSDISSMRFVNIENIYLPANYVVEITTTIPQYPLFRLSAGNSEMWANDLINAIAQHIKD